MPFEKGMDPEQFAAGITSMLYLEPHNIKIMPLKLLLFLHKWKIY